MAKTCLLIMALHCKHTSSALLERLGKEPRHTLLGMIAFSGNAETGFAAPAVPCLELPMHILSDKQAGDTGNSHCEAWFAEGPAEAFVSGKIGGITYRHNGEYLFGVITLQEKGLREAGQTLALSNQSQPTESQPAPALQAITEHAYSEIFGLLDTLQYGNLYRCWNYMADINAIDHGQERYRQFNIGRQDAMLAQHRQLSTQLPAACALGMVDDATPKPALAIAFLAGKQPSLAIENPRQVSAYQYPELYGPRSPSFSRASLLYSESPTVNNSSNILFISGTASIVGHQTLHTGDIVAQTRETLENLSALVKQANQVVNNQVANNLVTKKQAKKWTKEQLSNRTETADSDIQLSAPADVFDMHRALYRVYLRYASDMSMVRRELERVLGPHIPTIFVAADICRSDLLVEIEVTLFS